MTTLRVIAVSMTLAFALVVSAPSPPARAAEGNVTFGGQWWTQSAEEAKFQEFKEVPQGAFIQNFLLREWSGRNSLALWGANSIRSDQANRLTFANGVRWRADVGYAEIPHTFSFIARSPWAQAAPGVFTLSDSIQAANQKTPANYTKNMTELLANSAIIPLGFRTDISTLRLRARPARDWQFEVRGARRQRSGSKPYAETFGFSTAIEIPEPINQRTYDADVIGNYRHSRLTAQLDLGLSTFDNLVSTLFVDNPKRVTDQVGGDGPKTGALDLYPDNRQLRGSLALGYKLPKQTAVAATLGVSQITQDDDFLPFTNNKALGPSNPDSLPAKNADAKAVQLNGDVRLTTRPVKGLDGSVRFHYADYDNQISERQFGVRIPYDVSIQRFGFTSATDHTNHALSNTQWLAGVDADYEVVPKVKLGGTFEYRGRERTDREVEKDAETVVSGRLRAWPAPQVSVDARFTHADRKLDQFNDEDYFGLRTRLPAAGINPAVYDSIGQLEQLELRRFDVANRVQDRASGGISYAFGERLDLSASYTYLKSDYPDSPMGLRDETEHNVACAGTYHVNERLDLDGSYGYGQTETNQNSRQSGSSIPSTNPLDNWGADLKDTDVYVGAGIDWRPPVEKVSVLANYQFSRHTEDFDLTNATNTAQNLPSTFFRLHDVIVDTRYHWLKNLTLTGRYAWEQYDVVDFATNNVPFIFPTTGASTAIYLGDSSQSYRAHRLALMATFTF